MEKNKTYIALGSNLGDREKNIEAALRLLSENAEIVSKSKVYETDPEGYSKQDQFLNSVVELETSLDARELLSLCKGIEQKLGRFATFINGPRVIDVDILFHGDSIINEDGLVVPHPRLHERKFVLQPLNDIAPDLIHPKLNKSVKEMFSELE